MDKSALSRRKLAEQVLADSGSLPLALLLEHAVPAVRLREAARRLGLSPKGGFRIERAPVKMLAELLAAERDGGRLEEVLALLLPVAGPALQSVSGAEPAPGPDAAADHRAQLARRDAELVRLRAEIDQARAGALRARDKAAALERQLAARDVEALQLRRQLDGSRPSTQAIAEANRGERDLQRRVRDLEKERAGLLADYDALSRQLAQARTRERELQEEVAELAALVPKGRRKPKPPPPQVEERRFRLPRFLPSFYKSLDGKERRSVEQAVEAVLRYCTEGPSYPGLEVKQLSGQELWSMRASLTLRIYFRPLPDGDIELVELGNREDQNTTLRRLKDR